MSSALRENISKKGKNSYYYAHAKRDFNTDDAKIFEGDGLIYGGEPVLLQKRESQASTK